MWKRWRKLWLELKRIGERETRTSAARAVLLLSHWTGPIEQIVEVIGETSTRIRVRAIEPTRLPGKGRVLEAGKTALVRRSAVRYGQ
jgi:hypothetical protein